MTNQDLNFKEPISSVWCPVSRPPAHVWEESTFIRCPLASSLPHFPPGKLYPFIFLSAVRPRGRSSCTVTVHSLSLFVLHRELVLTQPCSSSLGTKTMCLCWLILWQLLNRVFFQHSVEALVSSRSHTFSVIPHIHIKSIHPQYFGLTAAAGGSKELFVAVLAVDRSLLLHKASVCQWWAAVGTVKLLLVPRSPHGHQEGSPEGQRGVVGKIERQTRRWKSTYVFTFYYAADSSREWWHSEWRASKRLPMGIAD